MPVNLVGCLEQIQRDSSHQLHQLKETLQTLVNEKYELVCPGRKCDTRRRDVRITPLLCQPVAVEQTQP